MGGFEKEAVGFDAKQERERIREDFDLLAKEISNYRGAHPERSEECERLLKSSERAAECGRKSLLGNNPLLYEPKKYLHDARNDCRDAIRLPG